MIIRIMRMMSAVSIGVCHAEPFWQRGCVRVCADACSGDGVAPGEIDAPCSIKDLDNFRDSRLRPAPLSIERIVFSLIFLIPIIAKDIILAIDAST